MNNEKLRVGIVGAGWFAARVYIPSLRETGRAGVVAISRRNVQRLAQAR